ncbi:MAG: hypothetical protein JW915_24380 [Chitinispirillaceae bacterium]|nr:hypothetical protein [Chitinispirillaceae bacterium]
MLKKVITLTLLFVVPTMLFACKSPDNVFEIKFNNAESIDVTPIEKIGELNVSYFKDEGKSRYTFRSHFQPSVMVVLDAGSRTLQFTVDTSKTDLNTMQYDLCVRTELDWLVDAGIVAMDRVKREKIENEFKKWGKSMVFYTKQDTLVHSSYALTSDGTFNPIDCADGPSIINLPPKSIEISTGINFKDNSGCRGQKLSNTKVPAAAFNINGRLINNGRNVRSSSPQLLLYKNAETGLVRRSFSF